MSHSRHQPGVWLRLGWLVVEGLPLLLRETGGHVVVGAVVEKNVGLNSEKRGSQLRSMGESRAVSRVGRPMLQSKLEAASKDTQAHEATT